MLGYGLLCFARNDGDPDLTRDALTDPRAVFSKKGQPLSRMTQFRYRQAPKNGPLVLNEGVNSLRFKRLAKNLYIDGVEEGARPPPL